MNTDNAQFDRLVDDELGEEERRKLLAGLDQEPNGWRRCALAFLESQCWKKAIGEVPGRPAQDAEPPAVAVLRRSPWPGRVGTLLAMAASFVAAMWLGSLVHRSQVGHPAGTDGIGQIADSGNPPAPWPNPPDDGSPAGPSAEAPSPWHIVTVSSPSHGRQPGRSIDVPAVERKNIDEQWLHSALLAMPDDVRQAFVRSGYDVQQQREAVPVPLKDGRQLVVPVDRLNVHYVGNTTY